MSLFSQRPNQLYICMRRSRLKTVRQRRAEPRDAVGVAEGPVDAL